MNRYLKMIGGYSLGPIVGALISFVTIPLITYFISPDEFGKVSMFTLATSLVELVLYLGLDQAYIKYYYELDKKEAFFNSMFPSLLLSIVCALLIMALHKPISLWLFDSENETLLVLMLSLYLPFSVIGRFHAVYARITEHAIRYSVFTILSKLLMLLSCIGFFYVTGKQYQSVIYATTFSQAIAPLAMIAINGKEISIKGASISWTTISKLLRYGMPLIPATIVGWILNSTDKVMIRSLCGYEQLGLYSAALKIVSVLAIIQSCFVSFWTPIAFRWNSENVPVARYDKVGKILGLIMALLFAGLLLFKDIVILILSPGYREAVLIIPFLLLHPIMYTISEVTVVGIYFTGKSAMTIIVAVVSCAINIVGNVFLVPRYGAMGASIATGVSYCVFFWVRTIIARKVWKKFSIDQYVIYTVFFLALCSANLVLSGLPVYIVNAVACLAIVIYSIPLIKKLREGGFFF